jgi:hypothetical protein
MPESTHARLRELKLENRDLRITSRVKDMFIEQLRKDREEFVEEREYEMRKPTLLLLSMSKNQVAAVPVELGGARSASTNPQGAI